MILQRHSSLNIHPGQLLADLVISDHGLTITKAAELMKVSRFTLSHIVNGKAGITENMAFRIAALFGGSATFWLNLQHKYDYLNAEREFQDLDLGIERLEPEHV